MATPSAMARAPEAGLDLSQEAVVEITNESGPLLADILTLYLPEEPPEKSPHTVINRTFLTAHLLTGGTAQAESAMMEAIASWHPDQSQTKLCELVLHAALRVGGEGAQSNANDTGRASGALPVELQNVLCLSPQLRQCYVLRILVGMPRKVCARLLLMAEQRVDHFTWAALRQLPFLSGSSAVHAEYLA
jgi:hypothetical protein